MRKSIFGAGTVQTSDTAGREAFISELPNRKRLHYIDNAIFLDEVDSTNTFCKSDSVPLGTLVSARRQTSGHGRLGRRFSSDEGGIYVSFCPRISLSSDELGILTGITATAVVKTAMRVLGTDCNIKWLNDIMFGGKKICGMLTECVFAGRSKPEKVIIGIGFNLNQPAEAFSAELSGIASSVYALTGKKTDENLFLAVLCQELDAALYAVETHNYTEYIDFYRAKCTTLGRDVCILTQDGTGRDPKEVFAKSPELFPTERAIDINEKFELITDRRIISSGEASIKEQ